MTCTAMFLTLALAATGAETADHDKAAAAQKAPSSLADTLSSLRGFEHRRAPAVVDTTGMSCADPRRQAAQGFAVAAEFHTEIAVGAWPNAHLLIQDYPDAPRGVYVDYGVGCSVEQSVIDSRKKR
jgi:hypothetical protein